MTKTRTILAWLGTCLSLAEPASAAETQPRLPGNIPAVSQPASQGNLIHVVTEPTGQAVQSAIDACAAQGGGVTYLPPGRYVSGPLWLKDNVELRLEAGATVVLSPDKKDWPAGTHALVNAKRAKHIAITGRGTFDGNAHWEYAPVRDQDPEIAQEQETARRAGVEMKRSYRKGDAQKYLFVLQDSEDVRLEDVTILNAPLWNVRLQDCNRVWIRGIFLYSDLERGVNSDGIDIVSSSNIFISDSIVSTADDAVCLKTVDLDHRGTGTIGPVENVVVNNCVLTSSSTAMMIGTETHADIRHVLFSNIIVRNSNKVLGIIVQDGAAVSDVRFVNITFDTSRRHWNWWGSAEVMKFVLKKRTPESRLGHIHNITIDGAQGTARGTSWVAGHAGRSLENITFANLRVRMLAENQPDKRATDALVFQGIDGLTLRDVEVDWDRETPEPKWGSALVLRSVSNLVLQNFHGQAARPDGNLPAVLKEEVTDRPFAVDGSKLVRLLFAGSSSSYWNDMPREVAKIVTGKLTGRPGIAVEPEMVGRSGSDIRVYSEPGFKDYEYGVKPGQSFLDKIRDERPGLVVLQTVCSFITDTNTGTAHADAVTRYCEAIRAAGGDPVFYEMGWGKSDSETAGRKRILELAVKNRIRFYAPCSTAWARVYRERPELALQHPKGSSHPGDLGHFLNLACFYAALAGESPVGRLPRTYSVWPHGLPKPETDAEKAADAALLAKFKPDTYQARMSGWMFRGMAAQLTHTLDDPTARYLETVAWETWLETSKRLPANPSNTQTK